MANESTDKDGSETAGRIFLYNELHALLRRVAVEYEVSSCTALGVLEVVKADILANMREEELSLPA